MLAGRLVVLLTIFVPPAPSHWVSLQYPGSEYHVASVPLGLKLNEHCPAVHVFVWQKVSAPGQSAAVEQPEQAPLRHVMPDPHAVPLALLVFEGTPPLHVPVVQAVSGGRLESFATTLVPPDPLHCVCLQNPGSEYPVATVPSGLLEDPQDPAVQVRVWQNVSVPGQLAGEAHPEQEPLKQVAPDSQVVPLDLLTWAATPLSHTPVVHPVPGGTLLLSITAFGFPLPSHCSCLQYPGSGYPVASVPLGLKVSAQSPALHVFVWQKESVPGQLAAVEQPEQVPLRHVMPSPHSVPLAIKVHAVSFSVEQVSHKLS